MDIFRGLTALVPRDIVKTSLNFKLQLPSSYFRLLAPRNQQARKLVTILAGEFNLHYLEEVGLLLLMGTGKNIFEHPVDPLLHCTPLIILIMNKLGQKSQTEKGIVA